MNHEFALHHTISELMKQLGLSSKSGPVDYVNVLEKKNAGSSSASQNSVYDARKKIVESCKRTKEFQDKFKELKTKNVKELDSFVYLISRLLDDNQVMAMLSQSSCREAEESITIKTAEWMSSSVTLEDVGKLKDEISKMTSSSVPSRISKKVLAEKGVQKLNIPKFPDWVHQRCFLSFDFIQGKISTPFIEDVKCIPSEVQEKLLVEDLLYCSEGIDGRFIRSEPITRLQEVRKFKIHPHLDPSLVKMVERILPMCSMYSGITRFIEGRYDFKHGLVVQALVAAMSSIMKEYSLLIARLEHQQRTEKLTLQKFWFYIQTTLHTLEVLSSVAFSIHENCRGGAVLSILHEKTLSKTGDTNAQKLCLHLTQAACVPYFEILENWVYKGIICDPYREFMVTKNDALHKGKIGEVFNEAYWENKYTLKMENMPTFLDKVALKILKTGKYLNVIRKCGRDVQCPNAEALEYNLNENQFIDKIENAIQYSSSLLLNMLMKELDLMTRLRSIKHYFLLDQGDFIVQFMDMTKHELKKPMKEIHLPRIETLLELALRTSTANADPYKDDLRVVLLDIDPVTQLFKILSIETKQEKDYIFNPVDLHLSGLESLTFDYHVKWPISLVLNRKALARYQILSRHLFYCKYIEQQLCNVWVRDKSMKMLMPNAALGSRAYALRQRMLNFIQNFEYYFMLEVIEPHWQLFESSMSKVTNVDEVLSLHEELLNNCLKDSMLTDDSLLRTLHKLMMTCVTFHNFMQSLNAGLRPSKSVLSQPSEIKKIALEALSEHIDDVLHSEEYEKSISRIETDFAREFVTLQDKIIKLSEKSSHHKLGNIILRLDFNGYYKKRLETLTA